MRSRKWSKRTCLWRW